MWFFVFLLLIAACFGYSVYQERMKRNGQQEAAQAEDPGMVLVELEEPDMELVDMEEQPLAPTKKKPKARRRKLKYFYKSKESGNVYPSEYWHMNNFVQFNVAGVNFRGDLSDYLGEFVGRIEAEPDNEYDPNAIRVVHQDGRHIGYVPKNMTKEVREFKELPCDCYCYVERRKDDDGERFYFSLCYVTEHPFIE